MQRRSHKEILQTRDLNMPQSTAELPSSKARISGHVYLIAYLTSLLNPCIFLIFFFGY
ncbi:hypothetical protein BDR05DRAFT_180813 [Suillus weaverae]|nr:hypothetical protein BDR05DRAFT_180813 [Suillus weaverae]